MPGLIDLRSDTVTRPTAAMREAMAHAEVGDDVYGDDPSVNALQEEAAALFGYEAALFVASGTQGNLLALMVHCERGDEFIAGQESHAYRYEGGGGAVLASIQPQPLDNRPDGSLDLAAVEAAIKPIDFHFARTRLLTLENTISGRVLDLDYTRAATELAHARGLSTHLDGARLCNAAVKLGVTPARAAEGFDSVNVCLSKGLGAPFGSLLCGTRDFVGQARRWRKMLGGGGRQLGIMAAAGRYALQHHIARLADDHANAAALARGLAERAGLTVQTPQTNVVYAQIPAADCDALSAHLKQAGILARVSPRMRMLTHLDVDAAGIERTVTAFAAYFAARQP